jgi:ATP-dependent Clp protease, protease subunit
MKHPVPTFRAAKKAAVLELYVYNVIGDDWGGGITSKDVQTAIKTAGKIDSINVHVNSPGGDCFEGVAIHNIIRQAGVPVNVIVEGLAASAAFTVSMCGDTIQACDGVMMMLHNAWCFASGYASDLRKIADLCEKTSTGMAEMYAKRSGLAVADVQTLMDAETWLSADESVAKGFATEKLDTTPEQATAAKALIAQFDLGRFGNRVPESIRAKAKKTAATETTECDCPCDPCQDGDCEGCTENPCNCENCTCENPAQASAEALAIMLAAYARRRRELEILAE